MTRGAIIALLTGLASCQPAFARDPFPTAPAAIDVFPEIIPDHEHDNCLRYINWLQPPEGDVETIDSPWGPITFKFFRGDGKQPDTLEVWDVPEGVLPDKWSAQIDEYKHTLFCFTPYEGL